MSDFNILNSHFQQEVANPQQKEQTLATDVVTNYQEKLKTALSLHFPPETVRKEWAAMHVEPGLYSPRLDLAVGPFATGQRYINEYDDLSNTHSELLQLLYKVHTENLAEFDEIPNRFEFEHVIRRNENARCFLAIEIENKVSNKHLMGGAINAAALGRIGLAVAWNDKNLRKFLRMRSYLLFLTDMGKNSFDPSNLLILTAQQLMDGVTIIT